MLKNGVNLKSVIKALAVVFAIGYIFSFSQVQAATTIGANISTDGYLKLNTSATPAAVNGTIHYDGTKFRCYENGAWTDCIGGISGTVLVTQGGTGLTSISAGSLLYASAANTLAELAGGIANNGKILTISGGMPTWTNADPLVLTNTYVHADLDGSADDCTGETNALVGDVCIVTNTGKSYILQTAPYSTVGNWKELLTSSTAYLLAANNLSDLTNATTARNNLDLGVLDIPNFAGLDITPGALPGNVEGRVYYNNTLKSLSYFNDNIAVDIGQKNILRVENNSGGAISYGQIVYISGANPSGIPRVALAQANSATTAKVLGFAAENIASGSQGYITAYGMLTGLNTAAYSDGDPVYLSATVAGGMTATKPIQPNYEVPVGYIGDAAASGTVLVFVVPKPSTTVNTGSIPYGSSAGYLVDDVANLFWDETNKRLGIGTNTPAYTLDVDGDIKAGDGSLVILGSKTDPEPAAPPAVNGAMYYNTSDNKFRCFENSAWKDCDTSAAIVADSLDFTDFSDTMAVDALTAIDLGANNLNITSTGAGVLTLTSGGAATWGTGAGNLNLAVNGAATGNVQIGTGGAGTATPDYFALDVKSTTGDPAGGAEGYMYYNTFDNKFRCYENGTWVNCVAATGSAVLSSITAATTSNSINNGDFTQTWNWNKTTNSSAGITFGENTASTGTGTTIVNVATLASSTAMPLVINNAGDNNSFRVNDTSPGDTTPFIINADGNVAVGATSFDPTNPEKLKVEAGTTSSINVISGYGDIDNYLQLNIHNRNAGGSASSDLVATADNGNENVYYIDVGINSSGYSDPGYTIGGPNDSYILAQGGPGAGGNLAIGTGTAGTDIKFYTGGSLAANEKMRIEDTGYVGIATTSPGSELDVKGTLRLSGATSGYVGLAPAAVADGTTYTLPSTAPTAGQLLSSTAPVLGIATLSWTSPGSTPLSGLTNATGSNILANGNNPQTWNWALATNTGLSLGETTAATGVSNILKLNTLATSTAAALNISNAGAGNDITANSWSVTNAGTLSTTGNISTTGSGTMTSAGLLTASNGFTFNLGSDAQGDIYYRNGSGVLARLAPGTSGQLLQTQGAAANPQWATVTATESDTLQTVYGRGQTINLNSGALSVSGANAVSLTPSLALTLTGGAASTWSTSAGALTLTSAAGTDWGTAAGDLRLYAAGTGTGKVQIGTGSVTATADMLILDQGNTAPSGATNGAMYYDTVLNTFRCYENGGWQNCGATAASATTLQQSYVAGNTITTALADGDFNVTGTEAVNLTPTKASQFTSGAALTLTGGASSTWGTSAGNLTLQAGGTGTANVQIGIGGAGSTTPDLFGIDVKSDATDPAGFNGAMYYNATAGPGNVGRFRCYEAGAWKDCDAGVVASLQTAYDNGGSVTTSGTNPIAFTLTSGNFNVSGVGSTTLNPTGGVNLGSATSAVNLPGLSASSPVFTDASKNLTSSGIVAISQGGTGQTTQTSAFDALSPNTTKGDLIAYDGTDNVRVPIGGTNGFVLMVDATQTTGMKWAANTPANNSLDFLQFSNAMTVDANTSINLANKSLTINDLVGGGAGTLSMSTNGAALTLTAGAASTWSTTAGALTINSGTTTPAGLNLGTAGTDAVAIGNGSSTFALTSSGGLNVSTGGALTGVASIDTISTSATALTFAGAGTIAPGGANTLTLGSTNTTSITNIQSGTGNINLLPAGTGTTANVQIGAGGAGSATPDLLALDVKSVVSGSGNPTGFDGAMYYNAADSKFRCYEGGTWKDCDSTGVVTLDDAYNNGNTIIVDGNAVTLTVPDTSNNAALIINQNDTTNNPVALQINNTGTGNDITSTNWSVTKNGVISTSGNINATGTGAITSAGILTGQAGLTVSGGAINLNTSGTGNTAIGNATGTFALTSNGGLNVTTGGVITGSTWQGNIIGPTYGGTGVNNGASTITLGGNLTTSGANALTLTTTGATNVTLPTTGLLMANPMTTAGDIIYGGVAGAATRLAAGTSTQVLHGGAIPSWSGVSLTADVTGTLTVSNGGTGATTFTSNGVLYGNTTGAIQATAAGTTGQCLIGNTGGAPSWGACSAGAGIPNNVKNVTGTAAVILTTAYQQVTTLTITPTSTSNRITINGFQQFNKSSTAVTTDTVRIERGGTACNTGTTVVGVTVSTNSKGAATDINVAPYSFVDSPATTSAITYRICVIATAATSTATNYSLVAMEVGP